VVSVASGPKPHSRAVITSPPPHRRLTDVADRRRRFGAAVLPLALDVTDPEQVRHVVRQAHVHFGRLDVVLNNAGYTVVGRVEEASEADVRLCSKRTSSARFGSFRLYCPSSGNRVAGTQWVFPAGWGLWRCRSSISIAPRNGRSIEEPVKNAVVSI
jgi:hypothetical protein